LVNGASIRSINTLDRWLFLLWPHVSNNGVSASFNNISILSSMVFSPSKKLSSSCGLVSGTCAHFSCISSYWQNASYIIWIQSKDWFVALSRLLAWKWPCLPMAYGLLPKAYKVGSSPWWYMVTTLIMIYTQLDICSSHETNHVQCSFGYLWVRKKKW
jgi:hypothetical protein